VTRDLIPQHGADECPVCMEDHRYLGPHVGCATHGHRLLPHGTTTGGRVICECPAHQCKTRVTVPKPAPERPPVTSQPAIHHPLTATPSTELAIRSDQQRFDKYQLAALRQKGIVDAPNAELAIFFHYCKTRGLDPFAHHATMVNYGGQWTIQTEIDGFRHLGHRAANAHGDVIAMPEPVYVDTDGNEHKHWVRNEPPGMVIVTILKNGAPFVGEANYFEFRKLHPRTGEPMGLWAKMPANQTRKCAEAQAWRMAYQAEFAGVAIEVPTGETGRVTAEVTHMSRGSDAPEHANWAGNNAAAASVAGQLERLGVQTMDEMVNLTAAFLGVDPAELDNLRDVPTADLYRIEEQLVPCTDIAQVHQLLTNGDAPPDDPALD
jgi:hypothetical protein